MNVKGIALYLVLSYALISVAAAVGVSKGVLVLQSPNLFQYLLLAALMGVPALCGFFASQCFPDSHMERLPIWPVPLRPAVALTLAAPILFATSCLVASLLGLTHPQWGLGGLMNQVTSQLSAPLTPGVATAAPTVALFAYPIISVIVGATLFAFIAAGSELGWRGYLFQQLLPLGAFRAALITGVCWGLWCVPLIVVWSHEVDYPEVGGIVLRVITLACVLSVLLGALVLRTGNLGVSAVCLGAFAGQDSGIWRHLFEQSSPPWTGTTGWINIAIWAIAAIVTIRWRTEKGWGISAPNLQ